MNRRRKEKESYLRDVNDQLATLGVKSSLFLEPISNGFAYGF